MSKLREQLAQAFYELDPWISLPGTDKEHRMTWQEAKDFDMAGYKAEQYEKADAALSIFKDWLEEEGRNKEKYPNLTERTLMLMHLAPQVAQSLGKDQTDE